MEKIIENQIVEATKTLESQLDAEIEKLDRLDDDELEKLRLDRLQNLKKQASLKQEWLSKGHGVYSEITEEKEFFNVCKESDRTVCHFYRPSTFRCKIVDKHLAILASSHVETRFVKLDVERAPFLVKRLNIKVLPTIALVKNGKTGDYIVGFDDLGGVDDFETEMLEWRLARSEMLNYSGDLLHPPDSKEKRKPLGFHHQRKTIRGKDDDDDDDSD